ncbi:hypothetical protein ACQP2F_03870 [Actinoplanes sp. CA-030573]|uniref:hypothetical protein n=1 Tax=Actinoplanes sp. CA-030573 TaxID=3239898 RepID=UPI003D928DF8
MLYGTPPRREHRAAPDGGLALFVRGFAPTGQHRSASRRRAYREPQRTAQILVRGLAGVIMLGLIGTVAFFVVAGERSDAPARVETNAFEAGPLASRGADPEPLSVEEVFPDRSAVRPPAAAPYRITITHLDTDCRTATTGELGSLLAAHGCGQVVRAGMVAPYGGYQVTAGLFNLADAAGAADVEDRLRNLVETGDGGFATLPAARTDPDAPPANQVGWRARGHYLLYCVITRPDGALVSSDDPIAERITGDLVDTYLGTTVLARRETAP